MTPEEIKSCILLILNESILQKDLAQLHDILTTANEKDITLDGEFFNQCYWPHTIQADTIVFSILGLASFYGKAEIIDYLMTFHQKQINVNFLDEKNNSPLHLAVIGSAINTGSLDQHDKVIELLLSYQANVKIRNSNQQTAYQLHQAMCTQQRSSVQQQNWFYPFFSESREQPTPKSQKISALFEQAMTKYNNHKPSPTSQPPTQNFEEFLATRAYQNGACQGK